MGLLISDVLSTFPNPTAALLRLVKLAFESNVVANDVPFNVIAAAIYVALTVKLFVVIPLVIASVVPIAVPVKVGLAMVGLANFAYADSAEINA